MSDPEAVIEVASRLIHKEDRENLVRDDPVRQNRELFEKLIEVERRRDVVIDLDKRC